MASLNSQPGDLGALARFLKVLWFSMAVSIALYWVIIEFALPPVTPHPLGLIKTVFQGLALAFGAAVLFLRFMLIGKLTSREVPEEAASQAAKLRMYYLLCYIFAEVVALYGFVLHFLGAARSEVALFFIAALALDVFCYPTSPSDVQA